jgi:hypothetical protein
MKIISNNRSNIGRPNVEDAPAYCSYFFDLTTEDNLIEALRDNRETTIDLIDSISPGMEDFKCAGEKWSVKMIFLHLVDAERFYNYKAFCAARKIAVEQEFDHTAYATNFNAENRTMPSIAEEFLILREGTINLFRNMTTEMLDFKMPGNKVIYTSRSLGWMAVGHNIHHCNIIKEQCFEKTGTN